MMVFGRLKFKVVGILPICSKIERPFLSEGLVMKGKSHV